MHRLLIVDIKMPGMNGIEMIRKAKEQDLDLTFVVLSGYGDYEFTSQAMELGVRHYILKPCDEAKIIPVLNKALEELDEARAQDAHSAKLENEARLLKPYAREQLFRDLLQGRALPVVSSTRQLLEELGGEERSVLLLDFRIKCGFDSLERYVVGNMLGDLLPDGTLLMTTGIDRDVLVLADAAAESGLENAVAVLKKEFKRFETVNMLSAASRTGMRLTEVQGENLSLIRRPFCLISAAQFPRASSVTSFPARSRFLARLHPRTPAPYTRIFMPCLQI